MSDVGLPSDGDHAPQLRDGIARGRVQRASSLVGLTARTAGEAALVVLRGRLTGADSTEFHVRAAERYAEQLGRSKGALMKVGQMLSFALVSPVVPAEFRPIYQTALGRLRTEAPPMPPQLTRLVLERELGRQAESAFAEFNWEPLAAASIGQVHAARLPDGRAVAVKIQYPGVGEAIRSDLKNAELLAAFLGMAIGGLFPRRPRLDLRSWAREVSARILEELDYRLEATNQAQFAEYYRGHPFIHIPEVIGELCTERLLTQELVRGSSWSEALTAGQELRDLWAEAIHRFVYGSYYRMNFFHADPHPGNYLFHEDGRVSFLDFGSVKRLRRDQVEMLISVFRACMRDDVLGTWRASVEAGIWRSSDPVTPEEVFAYWREDNPLTWAEPWSVVTPDCVARGFERRYSPTGPSANALRYITMPPEYAFMARIELGVASVIGELRAGNNWRSFVAEYGEGAVPVTAMGKREQAFLEERHSGHASGEAS